MQKTGKLVELRNAFVDGDTNTIDEILTFDNKVITSTLDVKYVVGKLEKTSKISVWSLIKRGRAHCCVLPYLLASNYISVDQKLVELLVQLIAFSGSYTHSDKEDVNIIYQINFLIDYIGTVNRRLLANYKDSSGCTLLHIIFYGHALNVDRERWFDKLVLYGVNPNVKSIPEIGSDGDYGLQTVHELAAYNLNYNVLQKCIKHGADVNEFEISDNRCRRNIIQEILFTYSGCIYQKNNIMLRQIYSICYLLIINGIDTEYLDKNEYNTIDCIEKYGWADTIIINLVSIMK
jgi:hypothetical protein